MVDQRDSEAGSGERAWVPGQSGISGDNWNTKLIVLFYT